MENIISIQQNCSSQYKVLAQSNTMIIVGADFLYGNRTRYDYIILEKEPGKEWEITQIYEIKEPATTDILTALIA